MSGSGARGGWTSLVLALLAFGCARSDKPPEAGVKVYAVQKTEAEWKQQLSAGQYAVLRQRATEWAYSGRYWDAKAAGVYVCAACGQPLFSSETKFDSGTGWPSFWQPVVPDAVESQVDRSLFMTRTEVMCARCGSHLGHVFTDGPRPTGLRYCINSAALDFQPR